MKISSPKANDLSPDSMSDPEEKEVSDEDDDDRNHKHRRRDTRSQSLERDSVDQVFTRPNRKHNKPSENGHIFRDNEYQGNKTWKHYNVDNDLAPKFGRRCQGFISVSRAPYDPNQRSRTNQTFIGDPGHGRGRGRDGGSWNHRDFRFGSADIASQMIQPGSVPPNLFPGRGLPSVSNSQNPSWGAFALMPGIPNGGLDALHSVGLPGTLRPQLTPQLNMGIPRQRCRDFEERGFCLRGDMCPMEHGVNRIVVDDVQSLSQFNLPVSLTSTHLLATPAGTGPLPPVVGPTTSLINSNVHVKSSMLGMMDDGMDLNGVFVGSTSANGGDFYDPDQPLWNNNGLEQSAALSGLHSPKKDESEALLDDDIPDHNQMRIHDASGNECQARGTTARGTNLSVWGRINSRGRVEAKDKISMPSDILERETKAESEALPSAQAASHHGKQIAAVGVSKPLDSSFKSHNVHNIRKPSQKAQRTLFVNGIPQTGNKRETLFSHFKKFGEIVDIYIPSNTERAFVQFSRREEAEAALESPDAVMGNRFIKLWWANRDSILDDGMIGSSTAVVAAAPRYMAGTVIPGQPSVAKRGKDDLQPVAQKINASHNLEITASESPKPVGTNGSNLPNPIHKKLETLEQLKEELRKKQEMLDQKRNDFRRQLDKLAKQATGGKGEVPAEPATKKPKMEIAADPGKAGIPESDSSTAATSEPAVLTVGESKLGDNLVSHSPTVSPATIPVSAGSQHPINPFDPFLLNKYKLDNRPAVFRVVPPFPSGFADVAVLEEHFSQYGDLSSVEVDGEGDDQGDGSETPRSCSAIVSFRSRQSAERAFANGKIWEGHNLQLAWLATSNPSNGRGGSERLKPNVSLEVVATNGAEGGDSKRSGVKKVELLEVLKPGPTAEAQAESRGGETS